MGFGIFVVWGNVHRSKHRDEKIFSQMTSVGLRVERKITNLWNAQNGEIRLTEYEK